MIQVISKALAASLFVIATFFEARAEGYVFYEDWENCELGALPTGWVSEGTPKTPGGIAEEYFSYGEGMKVLKLPDFETRYAVSYSTTLEGGKVDTRLTSPEIVVPASGGVLSFDAVNYNPESTIANKIEVFVRNESTDTEESVMMTRVTANNVNTPATYNISLGNYAGQKIRLVFVNEGTNAGLLGIGGVRVCEYIGKVYDSTPLFSPDGANRTISLSVGLFAPCKGYTAKLTTNTGIEEIFSSEADLSNSFQIYELSSTKTFDLEMGEVVSYTLTVVPNMEGVSPLIFMGSTGCADGYPSVCVEEEATGERCGYCPAGAAGLEKFSKEFGDRFIGIAIHCTKAFSTGVMESPSYAEPFVNNEAFPITGLPAAVINRRLAQSPTQFNEINNDVISMLNENSVAQTQIKSIKYDSQTHGVNVRFETSLALPLTLVELNAAVVLLADGLTGNDNKWWQKNYYSGTSKQQFLKDADESWWEYMQFYCEYPSEKISPTDMSFNHVAMGIYPDFYGSGCPLKSDWSDALSEATEINFTMPMQEEQNGFGVQDVNKTSIVVLILNAKTGAIIAADKKDASTYEVASVDNLFEEEIPVSTYYVGIDGIRSLSCPHGISIRVNVYSSGKISTEKIMN